MNVNIIMHHAHPAPAAILLAAVALAGCQEDEGRGWRAMDGDAPAPPVVTRVDNINGGAIIHYTPPKDDDLLAVVATYDINGMERTTKASPYLDSLRVEGWGREGNYKVTLRAVDKSRNESEGVVVDVAPLEPPVVYIYNSMKILDSFGGVRMTWENPTEQNIIVEVFRPDTVYGGWTSVENFYSSAREGLATVRGLEAKPTNLMFRVRDRWDNYSDTLVRPSLPIYEEELSKSLFRELTDRLPGDSEPIPSLPTRYIWDGNLFVNCFHSKDISAGGNGGVGFALTFDLGQEAKLSRFKMYPRLNGASGWAYAHNNLKEYDVYGAAEITAEMRQQPEAAEDGRVYPKFDNGWTLLMNVRTHKPSGADVQTVSNEDVEYIRGGDEHEVPIEAPSVRYVRLHFKETWSGGNPVQIGEMTFWGAPVQAAAQ